MPHASSPTISALGPSARIVPHKYPTAANISASVFGVVLGPVAYVLARLGIAMCQGICAVCFVLTGVAYYTLAPFYFATLTLALYSLSLGAVYFRGIAIVHFVVGGFYGMFMISGMLTFILQHWTCHNRFVVLVSAKAAAGASWISSCPHPFMTCIRKALRFMHRLLLSPNSILHVESEHFETIFLVREVIETVLQTRQAYQMSRLLPRQGLNRVFISLLVLNCWSTPTFHFVFGQHKALVRLMCLLSDLVLDFVSVIGVPVWLALDYLADFDTTVMDFPPTLWARDVWVVHFVNDAPLIFISSWFDAFSRAVFALSLALSISDIEHLIQPRRRRNPSVKPIPIACSSSGGRWAHWVHGAMVFYGFGILGVQLYAETRPAPQACRLTVRPWLVKEPTCAFVEINCITNPLLSGSESDFEAIVGDLNTASLEFLAIRHCPVVELPPRFQTFHNMIGIKIYNATITTWDANAAISQSHHPRLRYLYMARTKFTNATLPQGMLSSNLPSTLLDIEICGTNLNRLPDDLDRRWPPHLMLCLELGEFTEFPMVLVKLKPYILSMALNKIASLPAEALALPGARCVGFSDNPIQQLPDLDPLTTTLPLYVYLDSTAIADLPLWVDPFVHESTLFVGGTPFCVAVALNESSAERSRLQETRPWLVDGTVSCEVFERPTMYLLDLEPENDA